MKKDNELDPLLKKVAREKGTETPFSGKYVDERAEGMYACAICGAILFSSDAKFDATTPGLMGWPSFDQATAGSVEFHPDDTAGMHRTEVVCKNCGAHLGHVFETNEQKATGGEQAGKHYCINSVCLELKKKQK